jgi:ATP-dependent DNA ligase
MMLSILGEPKEFAFPGISPARELVLTEKSAVSDFLCRMQKIGAKALLARDPEAFYTPGMIARNDFIIQEGHQLSALIVRAQWGHGQKEEHPARYQVALESDGQLVPVGWVGRDLSEKDHMALSRSLNFPARAAEDEDADVYPPILLRLRIRGAHKHGNDFRIIEPVMDGFKLDATLEDADDLEKLEKICVQ